MINALSKVVDLLQAEGIVFSYSGGFSEPILANLSQVVKQKIATEAGDANTTKRLFSVFIEQVQNIIRYSAEQRTADGQPQLGYGMVAIGLEDGGFFILTANRIADDDAAVLACKLEQLSRLDQDELRALYRRQIKEPFDDLSKGAGVGLTEIALRSTRPIVFEFLKPDDSESFFFLKAFV